MNALTLVGQFYVFEDGNKIEVIQVKKTDEDRGDYLVTYHVSRGPNIPQKLVLFLPSLLL